MFAFLGGAERSYRRAFARPGLGGEGGEEGAGEAGAAVAAVAVECWVRQGEGAAEREKVGRGVDSLDDAQALALGDHAPRGTKASDMVRTALEAREKCAGLREALGKDRAQFT